MPLRHLRPILLAETRPVELGAGLYTLTYGAWFLGPGSFGPSAAYGLIAQHVSEVAYGLAIVALAVPSLAGLLVGDHRLRRFGAACNLVLWTFLVILVGLPTGWTSGGIAHFTLAAAANFWLLVRLGGRRCV